MQPQKVHISDVLQNAFTHHQAGRLREARKLYRALLDAQPDHIDALRGIGLILREFGHHDHAVVYLQKALEVKPDFDGAKQNLDVVLDEIAHRDEAVKEWRDNHDVPVIRFSESAVNTLPTPYMLTLAGKLMELYGTLHLTNVASGQKIRQLHDYFVKKYAHFFVDQVHSDALYVGDKRHMITIQLEGAFNDPAMYAPKRLMPIMHRLLGDYHLGSLGAVVSLPGSGIQHFHKDHPHLYQEEECAVVLPSFAVTAILPLVDMTEENGTTRMFKGTHRVFGEPTEEERRYQCDPLAARGDCVLMDFRLFHQGLPNRSQEVRPILYNIYYRRWFRDYVNYPKQVPLDIPKTSYEQIPEAYRPLFQDYTQ